MNTTSTKTFIALLLLTLSFVSLADAESKKHNYQRINELFEILAYSDASFVPTGAVCEQVAMVEFEEHFPKSQYDMVLGIEYTNMKEVIGELDLVIFDKQTKMAQSVIEIKCWKNPKGGLRKARQQRMRFQNQMKYRLELFDRNKTFYKKDQFTQIREYKSAGQLGVTDEGYDLELSLNLKELMVLRNMLLDCYAVKECPRKR